MTSFSETHAAADGAAATDASPAPPGWISWRGRVVRNERLRGKRHHYAIVELPEDALAPEAGQFYMLAPG